VYDVSGDTTTNVGLAAQFGLLLDGNTLAFTVRESDEDNTDLNNDGDTIDRGVLHVYNVATDKTTNLELALDLSEVSPDLLGNLIAFSVHEFRQGSTDLNGDGDAFDHVLHVYDVSGDTTTNLELASENLGLVGNTILFTVREVSQSDDLNGDGDENDFVLHLADVPVNKEQQKEVDEANTAIQKACATIQASIDKLKMKGIAVSQELQNIFDEHCT